MLRQYVVISSLILFAVGSIFFSAVSGQESYTIPTWVKNNAKWWADGQISESEFIKGIQYLIDNNILRVSNPDEINKLMTSNTYLQNQNQDLQTKLQQDEEKLKEWNAYYDKVQAYVQNVNSTIQKVIQIEKCKPLTSISNGTISWKFCDSRGNNYSWNMPFSWYDNMVKRPLPISYLNLEFPNGTTVTNYDYRKFVEPDFSKSIDQLYNNAGSDEQFIYETWFVTSQLTTYSYDMTNNNLWPLEVFTRASGDCKDTSILIASMLRSSEHTKNWQIKLVYLDAYHPDNPQNINHMMLKVITDTNQTYRIESTWKSGNALHAWDNVKIFGWMYDV